MLALTLYKLATVIQLALWCQPDAKIANGVYWTKVWLNLATWLIS